MTEQQFFEMENISRQWTLQVDDVMSELDERHRFALTEFIDRSVQTFVTTTNLGYFSDELLERANIVHVPVEGTKHSY